MPIQQWLPAIFCWLGTILPPKISAGSCTATPFSFPDVGIFSDAKYRVDADHNGIIDGNEIIRNGELRLTSPNEQYSYGANVPLEAYLMKDGKTITIDNFNKVTFDLVKLSTYTDGVTGAGKKLVYDRSESTE